MAQIRGPFDRAKTTQKNSPLCGILQSNQKESENMHLILRRNSEKPMCVLKHGSGNVMSTCIYIPDENVPQSVGIIAEVQEKILPLILPVSKLIHKTSVLNLCTIQSFFPIAFTSCGFFYALIGCM